MKPLVAASEVDLARREVSFERGLGLTNRGSVAAMVEAFGPEMDARGRRPVIERGDRLVVDVSDFLPTTRPAQLRVQLIVEDGEYYTRSDVEAFEYVVLPASATAPARVVSPSEYVPASPDVADSVEVRVRYGAPSTVDEVEGGDSE